MKKTNMTWMLMIRDKASSSTSPPTRGALVRYGSISKNAINGNMTPFLNARSVVEKLYSIYSFYVDCRSAMKVVN